MTHTVLVRIKLGLGVCAAAGVLVLSPVQGQAATKSFFNSTETKNTDMKAFKKWNGALARFGKEVKAKAKVKCTDKKLDICSYADWVKFVKSLQPLSPYKQLKVLNERMNQASYILDPKNWGKKDYWASPAEFMEKFGDCEDYAIIKYLSLKMLGWKEEDLRVVAVKDLNLKIGHAVLVVYIPHPKTKQKIPLVLDNQIKQVVQASKIKHYKPVFSINKSNWWRHQTS